MSRPSFRLTRPAAGWLLALCLAVLAAEAWYPFRLELPVWRPTAPQRPASAADGVAFDGDGDVLRSRGAPDWLAPAVAAGRLSVRLEARTDDDDQRGPARLLAVAADHHRADLMVGQDGDDLVVRLRRPGSDQSGDPAYRVDDVFADDRWRDIGVTVDRLGLEVTLDGATQLDEATGGDPFAGWDPELAVSLGDDPAGERSWTGRLRRAEVVPGDGRAVDLLDPGVLATPVGGWHWRTRVRAVGDNGAGDPLALSFARVLVFVPVGACLRRLLRRALPAAVTVAALAVLLTLGKAFVAVRHPSLTDTLFSIVGGLTGIALVSWAVGRRRRAGNGSGSGDAPEADAMSRPAAGVASQTDGEAESNGHAGASSRLRHTKR